MRIPLLGRIWTTIWESLRIGEWRQPDWAKALHTLHSGEGVLEIRGLADNEPDREHPFVDDAELSPTSAKSAFHYLAHTGLIKKSREIELESGDTEEWYVITEEGFRVAHDREWGVRDLQSNISSLMFASGLFLVAAMDFLTKDIGGWIDLFGLIGLTVVYIGFLAFFARQGELK